MASTPSGISTEFNQILTTSPSSSDRRLMFSSSGTKANPVRVRDRDINAESVYMHLNNPDNVLRAHYWIDDPTMSGRPFASPDHPFDLGIFSIRDVSPGRHSVTVLLELTDNSTQVIQDEFTALITARQKRSLIKNMGGTEIDSLRIDAEAGQAAADVVINIDTEDGLPQPVTITESPTAAWLGQSPASFTTPADITISASALTAGTDVATLVFTVTGTDAAEYIPASLPIQYVRAAIPQKHFVVGSASNLSDGVEFLENIPISGTRYFGPNSAVGITSVELFIDTVSIATDSVAPFIISHDSTTITNATHEYKLVITNSDASTQTIIVNAVVNNLAPVLSWDTASSSHTIVEGANVSPTTLVINCSLNTGSKSVTFTENSGYFSISPGSATITAGTPQAVTITYAATGQTAGTQNTTIIASAAGTTSATYTDTLVVTPAAPTFRLLAVDTDGLDPYYTLDGHTFTAGTLKIWLSPVANNDNSRYTLAANEQCAWVIDWNGNESTFFTANTVYANSGGEQARAPGGVYPFGAGGPYPELAQGNHTITARFQQGTSSPVYYSASFVIRAAGAHNYHPGFYCRKVAIVGGNTALTANEREIISHPRCVGGIYRTAWSYLEGTQGVYTLQYIGERAASLRALNPNAALILMIHDSQGSNYIPGYIKANLDYWDNYNKPNFDNPFVQERTIALYNAILDMYGNEPWFEGFGANEWYPLNTGTATRWSSATRQAAIAGRMNIHRAILTGGKCTKCFYFIGINGEHSQAQKDELISLGGQFIGYDCHPWRAQDYDQIVAGNPTVVSSVTANDPTYANGNLTYIQDPAKSWVDAQMNREVLGLAAPADRPSWPIKRERWHCLLETYNNTIRSYTVTSADNARLRTWNLAALNNSAYYVENWPINAIPTNARNKR